MVPAELSSLCALCWGWQGCGSERTGSPEPLLAEDGIQCNALLLTGPSGAGKTAAAYAVAAELGFSVLEVNCSDERSGASLLRLVGEATKSNRLRMSASAGGDSSQPSSQPEPPAPARCC